jgi:hypothetical protein
LIYDFDFDLTSDESWNCVEEDFEDEVKRTGEEEADEDEDEDESRVISELE